MKKLIVVLLLAFSVTSFAKGTSSTYYRGYSNSQGSLSYGYDTNRYSPSAINAPKPNYRAGYTTKLNGK